MRKELLLIRADLERAQLVQAEAELHRKFRYFSWLKRLLPVAPSAAGHPLLPRIHPMWGSIVSSLLPLVRPKWIRLLRKAGPLAKWAAISIALWKGVRFWRRITSPFKR